MPNIDRLDPKRKKPLKDVFLDGCLLGMMLALSCLIVFTFCLLIYDWLIA